MVERRCKTCGWAIGLEEINNVLECGCPLSVCFKTNVCDFEGKECKRWKKASDEYLRYIGELKS